MARRSTKIKQRNGAFSPPQARVTLAYPLSSTPDPSHETHLVLPGWRSGKGEADPGPPCGTHHMDQGLPFRKFKRPRDAKRTRRGKSQVNEPCDWRLFPRLLWPLLCVLLPNDYSRVSHPQHCGHLGWKFFVVEAVLCIVGCFAVSLASTYASSTPLPVVTNKNVSRHCSGNVPWRAKPPPSWEPLV